MTPSLASRLQVGLRCLASNVNLVRFQPAGIPAGPMCTAPYSSAFYHRLLSDWISAGVVLGPRPMRIQAVRTLALRHDLDSAPERATVFLEVERTLNVSGAYYFIADDCVSGFAYPYRLETVRKLALAIDAAGGMVGLHSIAWSQPDGVAVFEREKSRMHAAFGIRPLAWTHHGFMNPRRTRALRLKFEFQYLWATGHQFTQARAVVLSDSQGRALPEMFPAAALLPNFPNEFMTHSDYWRACG